MRWALAAARQHQEVTDWPQQELDSGMHRLESGGASQAGQRAASSSEARHG